MKLISVWSPKGGVGKTTLSLLLASSMKNKGYKVLVYDGTKDNFSLKFAEQKKTDLQILKLGTKIVESNLPDFLILDMDALTVEQDKDKYLEKSSVVLSPTLPSYPDLSFLNEEVSKLSFKSKFVFCFNKLLTNRKIHLSFSNNDNFKKWPVIKDREIYEKLMAEGRDLYSEEINGWSSVKDARKEIDELTDKLISKF